MLNKLSFAQLRHTIVLFLQEALKMSFDLFKIMVPMSILVRILKVLGLVEVLGMALHPVMEFMGLPGSMGMVWAAAMTNFYAGVAAFTSLVPDADLTTAQVTVLTCVMLVAHSIPVELRIAQKAGTRMRAMWVIRIGGAFLLGWGLFHMYKITGYLQNRSTGMWLTRQEQVTWVEWAKSELTNLVMVFLIVMMLLFVMKLLHRMKVIALLTRILAPILHTLGMSSKAAPIAIVGMTMGLTYGGGLIIQEAQSGALGKRDIFATLTLMGLSHGLIEDTLFMLALGGHISGVLWGRLIFTFLVVFAVAKALQVLPERTLDRFFFKAGARRKSPTRI